MCFDAFELFIYSYASELLQIFIYRYVSFCIINRFFCYYSPINKKGEKIFLSMIRVLPAVLLKGQQKYICSDWSIDLKI